MRWIHIAIITLLLSTNCFAANHTVNLVVDYKTVNYTGEQRQALVVNQQLPAPTLHFRQGDHVTLNVTNHLKVETAMHWHGLLVPWQMDGVLGVTQRGIQPGRTFKYQFTLNQSGTYWYHAHAGLQEQQGLYGALIIDPPKKPAYRYNKDYVIVLSDWINTSPTRVIANLKKDGDYYSPRFPLQASLFKFMRDYLNSNSQDRKALLSDYKQMQHMRMGLYDLSDVAYDAFLLNGHTKSSPWTEQVKVGDVVRLRFIGAGASTIFNVKMPDNVMQMVHVEGNDIVPYAVNQFSISPGETYDVLVKIKENKPYLIYAESIDTKGSVYGALLTSSDQTVTQVNITPFPEPLPVTRTMMKMMMSPKLQIMPPMEMSMDAMDHMNMGHMSMDHQMASMDSMKHTTHTPTMSMHHEMTMPTEPTLIGDKITSPDQTFETSIDTKYKNIKAAVKTNNPNKPIAGVINMQLFGYMGRYIWFINGVPEYLAKPIVLQPAKRYRIVFTNTSMMRHPMHIHGHWFIMRKGNDAYDPLLHTIEVAPGATITADLDTDASGQWFFHCHLLYHMMTGMARVIQYSTLIELTDDKIKPENTIKQTPFMNRPIVRVDEVRPLDKPMVRHPMAHMPGWWGSSFLDVGENPGKNLQRVTYRGLYGPDYNKLQLFMNDAEFEKGTVQNADMDIFYWHLLDQFWSVKGGVNYYYRPAGKPYWQPGIGIEGLMPYFIDTDVRGYFSRGSAKIDIELERDSQITNNFFVRLGLRSIFASKTVPAAAIGSGLNQMRYTIRPYYRLAPGLNLTLEYERVQNYGAYKDILLSDGGSDRENTLTLGVSVLL